jgi:hypothetical protein
MKTLRRLGLILLVVGTAPLAAGIVTSLIYESFGCLTQVGVADDASCLVGGLDIGDLYYIGALSFLLSFLTAPLALAGIVVLLIPAMRALAIRLRA